MGNPFKRKRRSLRERAEDVFGNDAEFILKTLKGSFAQRHSGSEKGMDSWIRRVFCACGKIKGGRLHQRRLAYVQACVRPKKSERDRTDEYGDPVEINENILADFAHKAGISRPEVIEQYIQLYDVLGDEETDRLMPIMRRAATKHDPIRYLRQVKNNERARQ